VVKICDLFEDENRFYQVSEVLKGVDLLQYISKKGSIGEGEVALIVKTLLEALQHYHAHDVVHGDLRPENILLERTLSYD